MTSVKGTSSARLPPPVDSSISPRTPAAQQPATSSTSEPLSEQAQQRRTGLGETSQAVSNFASRNQQAQQVDKQQLGVLALLSEDELKDPAPAKPSGPAWGEKGVADHAKDFGAGVKVAAIDTAVGLKDMAVGAWKMTGGFLYDQQEARATWRRTSTMVKGIAENPRALLQAMAEPYKEAWREGRPMEAIGRGTLEAAAVMLTTKGLDKVATLARGARAGGALQQVSVAGRITQKVAENAVVRTAFKGKRIYEGGIYAAMGVGICTLDDVTAAAKLRGGEE